MKSSVLSPARKRMIDAFRVSLFLCAAALSAVPASAQEASKDDEAKQDEDVITVTGWRLRQLDLATTTSSRLGLSVRETPATIQQITSAEILTRGFHTVEEATVNMPGVISGGSPGSTSQFSMRGFTGQQITVLQNGLYLGPSTVVNRPGNTFNVESIDVLKGPASVLYGQGAVGGVMNVVSKTPTLDRDTFLSQMSYGTFQTFTAGAGGNKVLSDKAALRLDASYNSSAGFVDRARSNSFNATGTLLLEPSSDLLIKVRVDYLRDNLTSYWGTPLVPGTIAGAQPLDVLSSTKGLIVDRRTRFNNYNVGDYQEHSWQIWPQVVVEWTPSAAVKISNTAYYFHGDRTWMDAEQYVYNPGTGKIDRDRFAVLHNQDLVGDQLTGTLSHQILGLDNKVAVGIDYSHLDFVRQRGFPTGDSVDLFNPNPGTFGVLTKLKSPTRWDQAALFGEDVLTLVPGLKLVSGLRAERLWLTRENYDAAGTKLATGFQRTYDLFNWRVGGVYDLTKHVTAYVSYTTGQDSVGSNIFLVNANQNFKLSTSWQVEGGIKADLPDGRGSFTFAGYSIERKNILTRILSAGTETVGNIGSQKSKGLELTGELRVTPHWSLIASGAYTDANFGFYRETGVDYSGNTPPNVAKWTANLWTTVSKIGGLPIEIGGGIKYIGARYGDNANSLRLNPYTLGIVYASYQIDPRVTLTARVNNLWDKKYVQWADVNYPNQVMLGEPRRFEVSVLTKF